MVHYSYFLGKVFLSALAVAMMVGAKCCVPVCAQQRMSLQSLFDLADKHSQRIKVSEVSLKAAEEMVASAKSALLPSVEFNVHGSGKSGDLRWWCYPLGHRDG